MDLKAAQLLLAGLGQPRQDCAGRVRLDELFSGPEALGWGFCIKPDDLVLMKAVLHQTWQVGMLRRANQDDLATVGNDAFQTDAQQAPFTKGRLRLQYFGQRSTGPTSTGQLGIQQREARSDHIAMV